MSAPATPERVAPTGSFDFGAFYDRNLPIVYGYVLRLCGGDRHRAEDLTQDTWIQLVDRLGDGHQECADIRWLISVARSRFIDTWRREQRATRKLRLAWVSEDRANDPDPTRSELLDHVASLEPDQRLVLTLKYVDGLPVDQVAATLGRSTAATYSLLARAREQLRQRARRGRP